MEKCVQAVEAGVNTLLQTRQQNPPSDQCFWERSDRPAGSLAICHHAQKTVLCKSIQPICVWVHSHVYFLLQIAWGQLPYHLQDTMWRLNQMLARSLKQLRSHKREAKYGGREVWRHQDSNHGITEWWPSFSHALCVLSLGRMLSLLLTSSETIWKERTARYPLSRTEVLMGNFWSVFYISMLPSCLGQNSNWTATWGCHSLIISEA